MKTQTVVIEFTIPKHWAKRDFVMELVGCYDDMAGEGKSDKVGFRVIKPQPTEKGN